MDENKLLTEFYNGKCLHFFTFFLHWELLGTPRPIFQRYHPGVFMAAAMQNPLDFLILVVY